MSDIRRRFLPREEGTLLQPCAVLPVQMPNAHRYAGGGERRLLAAVLADAVNCYRSFRTAVLKDEQRMFRESEEWLMSDDELSPFSFLNVCQLLDIDPGYLRQGLREERRQAERIASG